jgi:acyl carrier protein
LGPILARAKYNAMPIRDTILNQIEVIRSGKGKAFPPLTDDLPLLDSGLDSLGIAVLVTRLEDQLGIDPFSDAELSSPPVTLGDFVRVYERVAQPA